MNIPARDPSKFAFIDCLRGIAVLMVILYHVEHMAGHGPKLFRLFFEQGSRGVQLFFVVSAFTLYHSMSRRKEEKRPTLNYFLRRIFRILPAFYVGALVYAIWITYIDPQRSWIPNHISLANADWVGYLLTLVPFLAAWHYPSIRTRVPGGWSVAVETMFYILLPGIFKVVNTFSRAVWFTVFMVVLAVATEKLFFPLFTAWYGADGASKYLFDWLPAQMAYFGFGFIFYFWFQSENRPQLTKKIVFVTVVGGLVVAGLVGLLILKYRGGFYHQAVALFKTPLKLSYGLLFLAFCIWMVEKQPKIFLNKMLAYIGRVSYSAYLVHFLVIRLVTLAIPDPTSVETLLMMPICVVGTVLIARASELYIEAPANKLGKRLIERLESVPLRASKFGGQLAIQTPEE